MSDNPLARKLEKKRQKKKKSKQGNHSHNNNSNTTNNNNNNNSTKFNDLMTLSEHQLQFYLKGLFPNTTNLPSHLEGVDPGEMYELCTQLLNESKNQEAVDLYQKAIQVNPTNTQLMDGFGDILLQMDMFEEAKQVLLTSIQLNPKEGESKYLWMAQMLEGEEAIKYYTHAIEIMKNELQDLIQTIQSNQGGEKDQIEAQDLSRSISEAYVSIADLFLIPDLCDLPDAEAKCQQALEEALKFSDQNPSIYATYAAFRICQQRPEDALTLIKHAYDLFKNRSSMDQPIFSLRHSIAKTFLELDQPKEAVEIWMRLLDEDDTIAEVFYFLGLAWRPINSEISKDFLEKAINLLTETECSELQLLQDVHSLLELVSKENHQGDLELDLEDSQDENSDSDMAD